MRFLSIYKHEERTTPAYRGGNGNYGQARGRRIQGRLAAGDRRLLAVGFGGARPAVEWQIVRNRWSIHRGEGGSGRFRNLKSELEGRGDRVGQKVSCSRRRGRVRVAPALRNERRTGGPGELSSAGGGCSNPLKRDVIGGSDCHRYTSHHRRGLADGIAKADRRTYAYRPRSRIG